MRAYVLHPDLKTDRRRAPELALEEAVSLALALPDLEVVGSEVVRLPKAQAGMLFGSGKIAELKAHVDAEEEARNGSDTVSIRLATEFHVLLARMTSSPVLIRYVSEIAYRCCLTLSLYSRPHSSECAISEHRAIIAALVKGDAEKTMNLMHGHLDSVASRALVAPAAPRGRDLLDILAPYADEADSDRVVKIPGLRGSTNPSLRAKRSNP